MSNIILASPLVLKRKNVNFVVISQNGIISDNILDGFMEWGKTADMLEIEWNVDTVRITDSVENTRNKAIHKFLGNKEANNLIFVDPFLKIQSHQILQLLSSGKHIISGEHPVIGSNRIESMTEEGDVKEVLAIQMNCALISREALGHLSEHPQITQYIDDSGNNINAYFKSAIINNIFYSGDEMFCNHWRNLGGKVWIDTTIKIREVDKY